MQRIAQQGRSRKLGQEFIGNSSALATVIAGEAVVTMAGAKRQERWLETFPCGCREWVLLTLDESGDIDDEEVYQSEYCLQYEALRRNEERATERMERAFARFGLDSLEYAEAKKEYEEACEEEEDHFDPEPRSEALE
jgi:hypothetical protein